MLMILLFLFSTLAYGYIPTVESLLRNGANKDVGSNTVLMNAVITDVSEDVEESTEFGNHAVKILINNINEKSPKILQLEYAKNGLCVF